jgi:hypothetical protein
MKTVVTIGRQYGSGGREIGMRLAKEMEHSLLRQGAAAQGRGEKRPVREDF